MPIAWPASEATRAVRVAALHCSGLSALRLFSGKIMLQSKLNAKREMRLAKIQLLVNPCIQGRATLKNKYSIYYLL